MNKHFRLALVGLPALLLLLTGCQPAADAPATVTVTGTVRTATGKSPILAHVHLADVSDRSNVTSFDVDDAGAFSVEVPLDGLYRLDVTAVDHEQVQVPLLLDGEEAFQVDVALKPTPFPETFEEVKIRGDWGEDGANATATMEARDDGTYVFVAEDLGEKERVKYQLVGVAGNGHTVNGTHADAYEYDGGGDYFSLVDVADGRAEITFDPNALPAAAEGPRVTSSSAAVQGALAVAKQVDDAAAEYRRLRNEQKAAKEAGEEIEEGDEIDRSAVYADAREAVLAVIDDAEAPEALRSYAAARFLAVVGRDCSDEERNRALGRLPASSPFWAVSPSMVSRLDEDHGELAAALRKDNPVPLVRGYALAGLVEKAKEAGDDAEWRRLFGELEAEFGEVRRLDYQITQLNPDKRILTGKPVPEFKLARLDAEGEVSNESLQGNYVLIDFWATWCGPCIAEMPTIEKAWEQHKDKNFRILSLSFDEAPEDVAPFREDKFPMDWLHAFVEEGFDSELAATFEVKGIPEPILVDPEGMIVATHDTLRGEDLLTTLAEHLDGEGEASSGP